MNLLMIANRVVNLDHVTHIDCERDSRGNVTRVKMHWPEHGYSEMDLGNFISFGGTEARAIWDWLQSVSADALNPSGNQ